MKLQLINTEQGQSMPQNRYQEMRLVRLRQQRQRMENMKEVIEKYTQIIAQLQHKNMQLSRKNEQYQQETQNISYELEQMGTLQTQYQKQCLLRATLQNTVKQLKQDISILTLGFRNSQQSDQHVSRMNYRFQYETMQELYEGLKKQYYQTVQQNAQLKNILKQQQKSFRIQSSARQSKSGLIRIFKPQKRTERITQQSQQRQGSWRGQIERLTQKVAYLQTERNKQRQLIDRFKYNQAQTLQLIDQLKQSDSKLCICHIHAGSKPRSNKSNKIVSNQSIKANLSRA